MTYILILLSLSSKCFQIFIIITFLSLDYLELCCLISKYVEIFMISLLLIPSLFPVWSEKHSVWFHFFQFFFRTLVYVPYLHHSFLVWGAILCVLGMCVNEHIYLLIMLFKSSIIIIIFCLLLWVTERRVFRILGNACRFVYLFKSVNSFYIIWGEVSIRCIKIYNCNINNLSW